MATYFHNIRQKHPKLLPFGTSPAYDTVIVLVSYLFLYVVILIVKFVRVLFCLLLLKPMVIVLRLAAVIQVFNGNHLVHFHWIFSLLWTELSLKYISLLILAKSPIAESMSQHGGNSKKNRIKTEGEVGINKATEQKENVTHTTRAKKSDRF